MEFLVRGAVGRGPILTFRWEPRLPAGTPDRCCAVFVDGVEAYDATLESAQELTGLGRVAVLLDRGAATFPASVARMARVTVPVVLWGAPDDDERACEAIAALLFAAPVVAHLEPVLGRICTPEQREAVRTFLTRVGASTPRKVADTVARSRRSLTRDCRRLGLASPRVLLRAARVARGLAWVHAFGGGAAHAAHIGGYADPESWRRAVRLTFGVGLKVLLAEWEDEEALAARFRAVLLRG
jgi:AraC-like DNA-binding protein